MPAPLCPFDLHAEPIAAFLNAELADDPTYDGIEVQRFDDDAHGRGHLVFLARRDSGLVDYYRSPGLRLDPATFMLGAGVGAWAETTFDEARLQIAADGVACEVAFTDVDGRRVEVHVDDRDGRRRRRSVLLAPAGAATTAPHSLLLVALDRFDLVRTSGRAEIVIGGRAAATGRLPMERAHRRRLVKYGAGLTAVTLNRVREGDPATATSALDLDGRDGVGHILTGGAQGTAVVALTAGSGTHTARLALDPPLPDLRDLADGAERHGRWSIDVGPLTAVTGGIWRMARSGAVVAVALDVTERWNPPRRPWLMAAVTRLVPTFRLWPTTYRWTALVRLDEPPSMTSGWSRTAADVGDSYRRVTAST